MYIHKNHWCLNINIWGGGGFSQLGNFFFKKLKNHENIVILQNNLSFFEIYIF
jgi:hypothetical protein